MAQHSSAKLLVTWQGEELAIRRHEGMKSSLAQALEEFELEGPANLYRLWFDGSALGFSVFNDLPIEPPARVTLVKRHVTSEPGVQLKGEQQDEPIPAVQANADSVPSPSNADQIPSAEQAVSPSAASTTAEPDAIHEPDRDAANAPPFLNDQPFPSTSQPPASSATELGDLPGINEQQPLLAQAPAHLYSTLDFYMPQQSPEPEVTREHDGRSLFTESPEAPIVPIASTSKASPTFKEDGPLPRKAPKYKKQKPKPSLTIPDHLLDEFGFDEEDEEMPKDGTQVWAKWKEHWWAGEVVQDLSRMTHKVLRNRPDKVKWVLLVHFLEQQKWSWYADPAKLMRMGDSEELDRLMEEHANYCHNDREALMEGIKAAKEDRESEPEDEETMNRAASPLIADGQVTTESQPRSALSSGPPTNSKRKSDSSSTNKPIKKRKREDWTVSLAQLDTMPPLECMRLLRPAYAKANIVYACPHISYKPKKDEEYYKIKCHMSRGGDYYYAMANKKTKVGKLVDEMSKRLGLKSCKVFWKGQSLDRDKAFGVLDWRQGEELHVDWGEEDVKPAL